jgi:hypothetical protein
MPVRSGLKWASAGVEFKTLNTRDAENTVATGHIVQVSNMSFEDLGAMKKIRGNRLVSDIVFTDLA